MQFFARPACRKHLTSACAYRGRAGPAARLDGAVVVPIVLELIAAQAPGEGLTLHSVHGLTVFTPAARNGVSSRVATESLFADAIAAI
jgi:hypothetical protein